MKETKLENNLSPLHVWSLAFGCIIGWGAFVMPGNTFLPKAGPIGTLIAILVAAVVMILIAFNYSYMIRRFPMAGGEFTYTMKAFGKNHGFFCSWFLVLSYATLVPMNATALALIVRGISNDLFQFGFHYTVYGYDIFLGELFLSILAIVVFGVVSMKGVRIAGTIQVLLTASLVIGVTVIGAAAIFSDKASLQNLSPAFYPSDSVMPGILGVLAVSPFAFVGFDTVPQAAEEYGFSTAKTKKIMILSILFGAFVYILLNTVAASVAHEGYENWVAYIDCVPELNGLAALPTFYAAYELLGKCGLTFVGIAVLGAILSGIIGFYMATSRLLYSMASEKMIPYWFSIVDSKYKTPKNALFFHMLLSIIAPFWGRVVLGWLVDMASLGAAIGYGYTSLATLKYAKQEEKIEYMITGCLGFVMALIFIVILLVPIPGLNCSIGIQGYICLGIWGILGIVFKIILYRGEYYDT